MPCINRSGEYICLTTAAELAFASSALGYSAKLDRIITTREREFGESVARRQERQARQDGKDRQNRQRSDSMAPDTTRSTATVQPQAHSARNPLAEYNECRRGAAALQGAGDAGSAVVLPTEKADALKRDDQARSRGREEPQLLGKGSDRRRAGPRQRASQKQQYMRLDSPAQVLQVLVCNAELDCHSSGSSTGSTTPAKTRDNGLFSMTLGS